MRHIYLLLCSAGLWLSPLAKAQDLCYDHIPIASIIGMADTGDEIWMVTRGDGAYRYDKATEQMDQFTEGVSGLTSDYCNDLLIFEGELLLSTDTLVLSFSDGQFDIYLDEIGGAMGISAEGRLIVSSGERYTEWENGILYYEQDFFDLSDQGLNLSCEICDASTDITVDGEGTVWVNHFGFYEFDILSYDGSEWAVYDHTTEGNEVFPVESFSYSNQILFHEEALWVSSWMGLNQRDDEQWNLYHNPTLASGISNSTDTMVTYPIAVTIDDQGRLWVGSIGDGWNLSGSELAVLDDNAWHIYGGLPDYDSFQCLVPSVTDTDIMYAGTSTGLSIIDKNCLTSSIDQSEMPLFYFFLDQSNKVIDLSNYAHFNPEIYSIYDMKATLVSNGRMASASQRIDISELGPGQYSISLQADEVNTSRSFILCR